MPQGLQSLISSVILFLWPWCMDTKYWVNMVLVKVSYILSFSKISSRCMMVTYMQELSRLWPYYVIEIWGSPPVKDSRPNGRSKLNILFMSELCENETCCLCERVNSLSREVFKSKLNNHSLKNFRAGGQVPGGLREESPCWAAGLEGPSWGQWSTQWAGGPPLGLRPPSPPPQTDSLFFNFY